MRRRVLYFLEQSAPSRYYYQLFKHFRTNSKYEIYVLSIRPASSFFTQVQPYVKETVSLNREKLYYLGLSRGAAALKRIKPDIIHTHETIPAFYGSLTSLLSSSSAKLIYHRHHGKTFGRTMKAFDQFAFWRADAVVTVSETALESARCEHPRSSGKLRCILNGIDLYDGSPSSDESSIRLPSKDQKILLVGRFRPVKGHRDALLAMREVVSRFPNAGLFFAGTGELERAVASEIAAAQLQDSVFMLGHVADVGSLLRQVDVVIVPSLSEPFGLVAIEAMAAEKLVIASRVGGLAEIVQHKETGVLIEPGDPDALAKEIVCSFERPEERYAMAKKGYLRYKERYRSEVMARNYLSLYDELLGVRQE